MSEVEEAEPVFSYEQKTLQSGTTCGPVLEDIIDLSDMTKQDKAGYTFEEILKLYPLIEKEDIIASLEVRARSFL